MTSIHLIDEFYGVPIPEDAGDICFPEQDFGHIIQFKSLNLANKYVWNTITLPPGQWEYIGTSENITEEQAAAIIEKESRFNFYKNYLYNGAFGYTGYWTIHTATESFQSLLKSKSITERIAIIKKLK